MLERLSRTEARCFRVSPTHGAVARARHRIVSVVRDWRLGLSDDRLDELRLLVSEVVTNALVHAGGGCRIGVRWTGSRVRVEVTDSTTDLPHRGDATREQESGRGLLLVDALAPAWGAYAGATGKTVWFEIAPDEPGPEPDPDPAPESEPAAGQGRSADPVPASPGRSACPVPAYPSR